MDWTTYLDRNSNSVLWSSSCLHAFYTRQWKRRRLSWEQETVGSCFPWTPLPKGKKSYSFLHLLSVVLHKRNWPRSRQGEDLPPLLLPEQSGTACWWTCCPGMMGWDFKASQLLKTWSNVMTQRATMQNVVHLKPQPRRCFSRKDKTPFGYVSAKKRTRIQRLGARRHKTCSFTASFHKF